MLTQFWIIKNWKKGRKEREGGRGIQFWHRQKKPPKNRES
jgi:hypothetical protein